jgi:hypothetical protein
MPGYTGNVTVVLHNYGTTPFNINIGDKIAQMVLVKVATPEPHITTADAPPTQRGTNGFGSTGMQEPAIMHTLHETTAKTDTTPNNINTTELPYHIYISDDPFDSKIDITIPIKGDHPTLGMQLTQCAHRHHPCLTDMAISTPASRIPK